MWGRDPLIVSGSSGDFGGGLFSLLSGDVERIDSLTTMGINADANRFLRLLKSPDSVDSVTELLVYDERGIQRYYRLDGLGDPHDVMFDGDCFVIVSSIQNRVVWLSQAGDILSEWRAPGEADSWHINCLCRKDGALYLSVFGKFATHRGWNEDRNAGTGFLINLSGGEVISGFSQPHSPRFFDAHWVICNSAKYEVLQVDPVDGHVTRRCQLNGYTRGVAVFDDVFLVGESATRNDPLRGDASIAVINRATWQVEMRIPIATREIYDIVPVTSSLLKGISAGFRTNRSRVREQDQYRMFAEVGVRPARLWAIGLPLASKECTISISAIVPNCMDPSEIVEVLCMIENLGGAILITAPPNPVEICYRWFTAQNMEPVGAGQWVHTPLPKPLLPRDPLACKALVVAPDEPGEYVLRITLLQENVAWFDDITITNASVHDVHVAAL